MNGFLEESIRRQREMIKGMLRGTLAGVAERLLPVLGDRAAMESQLQDELAQLEYCKHLYVLDEHATQLCSNLSREGMQADQFGRNRRSRPYMQGVDAEDFVLSDAYISKNARRPSLTAIQVIRDTDRQRRGYLGVDYDLRELPHTEGVYQEPDDWRQIKGDPAIRGGLFSQHRVDSLLDNRIDDVNALLTELFIEQGVFHGKLHYSSNRATLWLVDDPYRYRLLGIDELLDPDICLAYPRRDYTALASVPKTAIKEVFERLKTLRFADENIYLRSGSLNICNGLVGLNFSCDGSHYMQYHEFLDKDQAFWFGSIT